MKAKPVELIHEFSCTYINAIEHNQCTTLNVTNNKQTNKRKRVKKCVEYGAENKGSARSVVIVPFASC